MFQRSNVARVKINILERKLDRQCSTAPTDRCAPSGGYTMGLRRSGEGAAVRRAVRTPRSRGAFVDSVLYHVLNSRPERCRRSMRSRRRWWTLVECESGGERALRRGDTNATRQSWNTRWQTFINQILSFFITSRYLYYNRIINVGGWPKGKGKNFSLFHLRKIHF